MTLNKTFFLLGVCVVATCRLLAEPNKIIESLKKNQSYQVALHPKEDPILLSNENAIDQMFNGISYPMRVPSEPVSQKQVSAVSVYETENRTVASGAVWSLLEFLATKKEQRAEWLANKALKMISDSPVE